MHAMIAYKERSAILMSGRQVTLVWLHACRKALYAAQISTDQTALALRGLLKQQA